MDAAILEWIHRHGSPVLDAAFRLSHELATQWACAALVVAMTLVHLVRRERTLAVAWLALGVAVAVLPEILKALTARPRPGLWPPLVQVSGYSFPSGHATAGASLFPLAAHVASQARPAFRGVAWGLALALGLFVGVGRLYLGVHWPSDVLVGWLLGAALYAATAWWLGRASSPGPVAFERAALDPEEGSDGPR